jgi:Flp pilus assembly protein TadD
MTAPAERVWRDVLDRDPHHPLALHGLGLIALRAGKTSEAVDLLRKAVAAAPYGAQALADLGRALEAAGDATAAHEAWSRAYAYDPSRQPTLKPKTPVSQVR